MPYITAAVIAGTAIYGAVEANNRKKKAKAGIEKLKRMQPKYRPAEEIQAEAENAIQHGYSASERANFDQAMARRSNMARRIATDRNPNLAGAVNAGINYGNIQGQLGFAASDAALRRQRVENYVSRITGQSNNQTNADITSKMQQEIAYGNAKNQAQADIYNSIMQLGYAGASAAKAYNGAGGYSSANTTPTTTGVPLESAVNPAQPTPGTDQWARNLYGNPNPLPPQPYFGDTSTIQRQPLYNRVPSRQAQPYNYSFDL
jgi:hypothetical protein